MQLFKHNKEIEALGAQFVVIGNGAPNFIEGFRKHTKYTGLLYTDPSLESYKALDFRRSVWSTLGFKSMSDGLKAWKEGFRQSSTQGDAWQQGGVIAVNQAAEVLFFYQSERAGDHPETNDILEALKAGV